MDFYFSKGFVIKIRDGNKVNTEIIASNIAIPVNTPKQIVGINLEKTKIENPNTIVIDVFNIATPTVE